MARRATHTITIISKERSLCDDRFPERANYNAGIAYEAFDDGTLSLVLAPGVVLDSEMYDKYYINLKPIDND